MLGKTVMWTIEYPQIRSKVIMILETTLKMKIVTNYHGHSITIWGTHWGLVTHTCICNPTIIGSDNGLSPGRRQAIIWANAEILLTGPI